MIGARLRQARLAVGLTLEAAVAQLATQGQQLTKAGLSKYERGGSVPTASTLFRFARVYGVEPDYFLNEPVFPLTWVAFRCRASLAVSRQDHIKAVASDVVAGQLWLQSLLHPDMLPAFPEPTTVCTLDDAERAANRLRAAWSLGTAPIDSVTHTVEDHGGVVVGWNNDEGRFDGLAGWAGGRFPVVVVNRTVSTDRQRFNLAHELGHLVLRCELTPAATEEQLAHRFASAFLMPAEPFIDVLGGKRRHIDWRELGLLKRRFGLSLGALIRRSKDLQVIDDATYQRTFRQLSRLGWRKQEPYPFGGSETSTRLEQLTLHALAEGLIRPERARQLCPGCASTAVEALSAAEPGLQARDLLRLSGADRERVLTAVAETADSYYRSDPDLTGFDAFGDADIHDDTPAR